MMWLPVVITLVVVIIVAAAFLSQGRGNRDLETLFLVMTITIFITGLSMGFFVTHFASPTLATWPWAIGVRATWQLGGTLLILAYLWRSAVKNGNARKWFVWALAGVAAALGLAAARNPVLDLVSGPQELRLVAFDKSLVRTTFNRGGPEVRIFANMKVISPDGQPRDIDLAGWSAETADEILDRCESLDGATVTVLAHVERVLEVRCPEEADG